MSRCLLKSFFGFTTRYRMFQKHLKDDGKLQYGDFMNDLSKIMVKYNCLFFKPLSSRHSRCLEVWIVPGVFANVQVGELDDKINFYVMSNIAFFKNEHTELKANAALFTGMTWPASFPSQIDVNVL